MERSTARRWIWVAVVVQVGGLAFDVVWHGFVNPSFEAKTVGEMAAHLGTVHLPIYIGALSVLAATTWALIDRRRQSAPGGALPFAFAGAVLSTAGEAWHAYSHLQLSTHSGPIAALTSFIGLLVVVVATWIDGRQARRRAAADRDQRRAA